MSTQSEILEQSLGHNSQTFKTFLAKQAETGGSTTCIFLCKQKGGCKKALLDDAKSRQTIDAFTSKHQDVIFTTSGEKHGLPLRRNPVQVCILLDFLRNFSIPRATLLLHY